VYPGLSRYLGMQSAQHEAKIMSYTHIIFTHKINAIAIARN
jgi:hypothetical protein